MISIRQATRQDMASILDLVKELAVYEKSLDQVSATVADYEANFDAGVFEALVAEENGKILGMALYYLVWSTWRGRMLYLDDFVVREAHRNRGLGQLIYDRLVEIAKEKDCFLLKWQVLDWNEPALQFYRKNEAIIEKDWWNCKIFLKKP